MSSLGVFARHCLRALEVLWTGVAVLIEVSLLVRDALA
jgi:hypothetical protein